VQATEQQAIDHHSAAPQEFPASATQAVCEFLLASNRLKHVDLKRAETYQEQNGGDLVLLLVRLGLVSERDVAEAESSLLGLPFVRTADFPDEVPELAGISLRYLKKADPSSYRDRNRLDGCDESTR
jgi:general secretion pathway protein E